MRKILFNCFNYKVKKKKIVVFTARLTLTKNFFPQIFQKYLQSKTKTDNRVTKLRKVHSFHK